MEHLLKLQTDVSFQSYSKAKSGCFGVEIRIFRLTLAFKSGATEQTRGGLYLTLYKLLTPSPYVTYYTA
jgi:hypothetical protein